MKYVITSEQVGSGHPDKLADLISDIVLAECLYHDPESRVACETLLSNRLVVVGGELRTTANIDIHKIVKDVLLDYNYDPKLFTIINNLNTQSPDIAQGVDIGGAGDQGIMFGYATNETENKMPLAWNIANNILIRLEYQLRESDWYTLNYDMKSQVSVVYEEGKDPVIDTILVSCQVLESDQEFLKGIVKDIINTLEIEDDYKFLFNPTGKFEIGGPIGDAGLTGRKIIADTYGGYARHGGGAFSGKDASKVDRSAAYMARHLAKHIVTEGLADECEIQLSYAIGVAEPVSILVETINATHDNLERYIRDNFDLTPKGIIEYLDLKNYKQYGRPSYGHFGHEIYKWEQKARL